MFGDEQYLETNGKDGEPPEILPKVPIWLHFDECSTHLDARTKAHEVANQYLPLVKRFEDMRKTQLTTEFIFKTKVKTAEIYSAVTDERDLDNESVVYHYLESSLIEYYYRNVNKLIRATDEANVLIEKSSSDS